jgi:hypothetical protein
MAKKTPRRNHAEAALVSALDKRAITDDISQLILPILRQAMLEKWEPSKIRTHPMIQCLLEAKKITIALQDPDAGKSLAAIRDVNDRVDGKPVERREQTHKYEKLRTEELDALLLSESASLDDMDKERH